MCAFIYSTYVGSPFLSLSLSRFVSLSLSLSSWIFVFLLRGKVNRLAMKLLVLWLLELDPNSLGNGKWVQCIFHDLCFANFIKRVTTWEVSIGFQCEAMLLPPWSHKLFRIFPSVGRGFQFTPLNIKSKSILHSPWLYCHSYHITSRRWPRFFDGSYIIRLFFEKPTSSLPGNLGHSAHIPGSFSMSCAKTLFQINSYESVNGLARPNTTYITIN